MVKACSKPTVETTKRRTFKILLDFGAKASWQDGYLDRWLNRQHATQKIGANTKIEYEVLSKEATWEWQGRDAWLDVVARRPLPEKQQAEVHKMALMVRAAVREAQARERREQREAKVAKLAARVKW